MMDRGNSEKSEGPGKFIPLVIIGLSLAMALGGWVLGEGDRVLAQASQICLSCMGLGG
ncbi:MAG: hypothetical protein MI747_02005 [Desulfobacterales bacterium]|nr:hypothetical protein [Desulfobacterales bacterium]